MARGSLTKLIELAGKGIKKHPSIVPLTLSLASAYLCIDGVRNDRVIEAEAGIFTGLGLFVYAIPRYIAPNVDRVLCNYVINPFFDRWAARYGITPVKAKKH